MRAAEILVCDRVPLQRHARGRPVEVRNARVGGAWNDPRIDLDGRAGAEMTIRLVGRDGVLVKRARSEADVELGNTVVEYVDTSRIQ